MTTNPMMTSKIEMPNRMDIIGLSCSPVANLWMKCEPTLISTHIQKADRKPITINMIPSPYRLFSMSCLPKSIESVFVFECCSFSSNKSLSLDISNVVQIKANVLISGIDCLASHFDTACLET